MKTKYAVYIIVVAIVALLGFNFIKNSDSSSATAEKTGAKSNASKVLAKPFSAISEADFKKFLAGKSDTVVIDIRTPQEVAQGKIAENPLEIDYYGEHFLDELAKLDKDKTYFIYCAHGNRTGDTKGKMKGLGFTKVYDLKGGFITWKGKLFGQTSRTDVVQKFLGKPSVIFIAGTYCPHCRDAMPEYETKVWDVYNEKVNVFVNVIDNKKFEQKRIAQGTDTLLTFKTLVGEECGYVPSWILLNKDGEVQENSCGVTTGLDVLVSKIDGLLK